MCPMQSVAALVDKTYWNGTHSASTTLVNCLAKVLPTKRPTEDPVAIPLTPPSGFARTANLANMNAGLNSAGICHPHVVQPHLKFNAKILSGSSSFPVRLKRPAPATMTMARLLWNALPTVHTTNCVPFFRFSVLVSRRARLGFDSPTFGGTSGIPAGGPKMRIQVFKCSSVLEFTCLSVQLFKCAIQVFKAHRLGV